MNSNTISNCILHGILKNTSASNCIYLPKAYIVYGEDGFRQLDFAAVIAEDFVIRNPDFTLPQVNPNMAISLNQGQEFGTPINFYRPVSSENNSAPVENYATIKEILRINQYGNPVEFGNPVELKKIHRYDYDVFTIENSAKEGVYVLDLYKKVSNGIIGIYQTFLIINVNS